MKVFHIIDRSEPTGNYFLVPKMFAVIVQNCTQVVIYHNKRHHVSERSDSFPIGLNDRPNQLVTIN